MDEDSLEPRPDDTWLSAPDTASVQDLALALRLLGGLGPELVRPDSSEEERAARYRRIRHLADWVCACTTALTAADEDPFGASDTRSELEPGELSHAMLIATLMSDGGSRVLPSSAMEAYALTGPDGALHAAALEQLPDGLIRISVCPRPDTDGAGTDSDWVPPFSA
jgi:hypothetical protein